MRLAIIFRHLLQSYDARQRGDNYKYKLVERLLKYCDKNPDGENLMPIGTVLEIQRDLNQFLKERGF